MIESEEEVPMLEQIDERTEELTQLILRVEDLKKARNDMALTWAKAHVATLSEVAKIALHDALHYQGVTRHVE